MTALKKYVRQTFLFSLFFAPLFFGVFWLMFYPLFLSATEGLAIVGQIFLIVWLQTSVCRVLFEVLLFTIECVQSVVTNRTKQKVSKQGVYVKMKLTKSPKRQKGLIAPVAGNLKNKLVHLN